MGEPPPTTPDIIAQLEAREAALLDELATVRRMLAAARGEGLTPAEQTVKSNSEMVSDVQVRQSENTGREESSLLPQFCRKRGVSLRALAKRVAEHPKVKGKGYGCSYATLSAGAAGNGPIHRVVCEVVEELTAHGPIPADPVRGIEALPASRGYRATKRNWKKMFG